MDAHRLRRNRILANTKSYDNVLVTKPQNLFYLTGFWGGGIGVILDDRAVLITSRMEKERARGSTIGAEVVGVATRSDLWDEVRKRLKKGPSIADSNVERKVVRKLTVDDGTFLMTRRTKDAEEIEKISTASRKIDRIFELIEREVKEGATEREVAAEVLRAATLEGLTPFGSEGSLSPVIVAAGENGAYPHAEITDRVLREGDLVVVDLFFRFEGYGSDETRTFGVGRISREKRDAYQAVLAAQETGVRLSRMEVDGKELHTKVSQGLRSRERYFTHGTGHGVGIDLHEMPNLGKMSGDILQENDVVTIEPGIYLPGSYGIRIEDTVLVGMQPAVLTHYTKELVFLG